MFLGNLTSWAKFALINKKIRLYRIWHSIHSSTEEQGKHTCITLQQLSINLWVPTHFNTDLNLSEVFCTHVKSKIIIFHSEFQTFLSQYTVMLGLGKGLIRFLQFSVRRADAHIHRLSNFEHSSWSWSAFTPGVSHDRRQPFTLDRTHGLQGLMQGLLLRGIHSMHHSLSVPPANTKERRQLR